jgi:hypothetical protein
MSIVLFALLNKYGSITVRLRRSIDAVDEPVMNRKYTERVRFVMAKIKRERHREEDEQAGGIRAVVPAGTATRLVHGRRPGIRRSDPFVALAAAGLLDPQRSAIWQRLALHYGAVILSFVGALHWGCAMIAPA